MLFQFWAPHTVYTRCLIHKLESIQRRAARVMSDYHFTNSVSVMLHRLEWNTMEIMESQIKVLSLVVFYKTIHGQVDVALYTSLHSSKY